MNVLGAGMPCIREYFLRKQFSIQNGTATLHIVDVAAIGRGTAAGSISLMNSSNAGGIGQVRWVWSGALHKSSS